MILTKTTTIASVQHQFQQVFPNLKIEFYKEPHAPGQGSTKRNHLDPDLMLAEAGYSLSENDIILDENQSVQELESIFADKFGLFVQVFRKSGNLWMQTTTTDQWTLAEQNRKGGASEEHYFNKP
jgi:hypothetical protein